MGERHAERTIGNSTEKTKHNYTIHIDVYKESQQKHKSKKMKYPKQTSKQAIRFDLNFLKNHISVMPKDSSLIRSFEFINSDSELTKPFPPKEPSS